MALPIDHPHKFPPNVLQIERFARPAYPRVSTPEDLPTRPRTGWRVQLRNGLKVGPAPWEVPDSDAETLEDLARVLWAEWSALTGLSKQATRGAMAAQTQCDDLDRRAVESLRDRGIL